MAGRFLALIRRGVASCPLVNVRFHFLSKDLAKRLLGCCRTEDLAQVIGISMKAFHS